MKVEARVGRPEATQAPLLALPWCQADAGQRVGLADAAGRVAEASPPELEALDVGLGQTLSRALDAGDFRGTRGETLLLYGHEGSGPARVLVVGIGARGELTAERVREAAGRAVGRARELRLQEVSFWLPGSWLRDRMGVEEVARALGEGAVLAAWRFDEYRSDPEQQGDSTSVESAAVLVQEGQLEPAAAGVAVGSVLANAQNYARELAARPANVLNPRYLADEAERLGREAGLEVTVLDLEGLAAEGMSTLLAVAAGSEEEPRFVCMHHRGGGNGRPLVLVGKGVTFDAGGLSLKTPQGMETMKYDMSGAAAVLGAMRAVSELAVPLPVVGLIPAVENLPSGHALRPGDVIRSHSGKTIEVLNTDAEGRLILADALSYAERYEPAAMVDIATLTGACVVALGHHAIGLMGNDPGLVEELREAADRSGERVWQLPLWDDYREQLKSTIADIKNTGGRPAGTITAGMFLREFAGSTPWAHLDIAGTAWAGETGAYQPEGPTGVGVRLLTEWVRGRAS